MPALNTLRQPATLDHLLNYRLMRLYVLVSAPVRRLCEGHFGITRREWRVVALLGSRGELSPSLVAEEGGLDRARASRAIGTLVAKGLVARSPLAGDKRRARVGLTPEGRQLHDALFPLVIEINQSVLAALDDAAVAVLDTALQRLTERAGQLQHAHASSVPTARRSGGTRRLPADAA